ncbi:MAG: hemerythrin domain-containing protein [Thiogranum sp.]
MYSVDELKKQNEDIAELCDVLSVLIEHRSLHNNSYVCELMARFKEKVWMHLVFEDNTIYAELIRHNDKSISDTARGFHDSAKEIRRCFSHYVKHWCGPAVDDADHDALLKESGELFRLVKERINYENVHMFPLIE